MLLWPMRLLVSRRFDLVPMGDIWLWAGRTETFSEFSNQ